MALKLDRIFSDGMILQREKPVAVWGTADPGQTVTVRAQGQSASVVTDADGAWRCELEPLHASESEVLTVRAGDEHDIHPKVKQPVGERLALLALQHLYGRDVLGDAPHATEATRDGAQVTVSLEHADDGLVIEGNTINALEVSDADGAVAFDAHVAGDSLVITLGHAPAGEVNVHFAQTNWYRVNLYNSAHIPALPFKLHC